MKNISLNIDKALGTVSKEQVYAQEAKAMECIATVSYTHLDVYKRQTLCKSYYGERAGCS